MTDDVRVGVADGVMTITIDRPEQRNAMTLAAAERIAAAVTELDACDDVSVGILTGSGGTFCAGMDLKRFLAGERPYINGKGFGGLTEAAPRKPLLAAVEGWALGGGFELVLTCDLVVAAASARFGLPEVKRGLVARAGGLFRAPARLPRAVALELLLTGDPLSAQRASAYGLVNAVVPDGSALAAAVVMAGTIAANAPLAVQASKAVAIASANWSDAEAFDRQREWTDAIFASADAQEGATAFRERRAPQWQGA